MRKNYKKSDLETFHIIYFWMSTQLNLKGIDKDIFALIYGYTKQGGCFNGSLEYLMAVTGCAKQTVLDSLDRLQGIDPSIKYKQRKARQKSVHYYKLINKKEKLKGNEYRSLITAQKIDDIITQIKKLKEEQDARYHQSEIQTDEKLENQSEFLCNQSENQTNNGLNFRHNNILKYIKDKPLSSNINYLELIDREDIDNFLKERELILKDRNILKMTPDEIECVKKDQVKLVKKYCPDLSESEISMFL